jgi:hypothetical protein
MFLTAIFWAVAFTGPFQATQVPKPEPIWPSGPILGTSTADEERGLRLRLTKFEQEIVWADASEADKAIREAGIGTGGGETVIRGKEVRFFFMDRKEPTGRIAERSRRALGRALWRRIQELGKDTAIRQVDVVDHDTDPTTAAKVTGRNTISQLRGDLRRIPESLFQFGPRSRILRVRVVQKGGEELGFCLGLQKDRKQLAPTVGSTFRRLFETSMAVAKKRAAEKNEWIRKNPGKQLPKRFFSPPPGMPVILEN